jgi:transcriptional regulator with XRE-family HTH domain
VIARVNGPARLAAPVPPGDAAWNAACDGESCGRGAASRKEVRRRAVEVTGGVACFGDDRREKTMVEVPFSNSLRNAFEPESSFADCLRQARRRLDVKQVYLSAEIGCSDAAVSYWEAGHRVPTLSNLRRILAALSAAGATAAEQLALREAWLRQKSRVLPVLPRGGIQHAADAWSSSVHDQPPPSSC